MNPLKSIKSRARRWEQKDEEPLEINQIESEKVRTEGRRRRGEKKDEDEEDDGDDHECK